MLVNYLRSMNKLSFLFLNRKAFISLDQMLNLSFFEYKRGIIKILQAFIVADKGIIFEISLVILFLSLGHHLIKLTIHLNLMNHFLMKRFGPMRVVFFDDLISTTLAFWL